MALGKPLYEQNLTYPAERFRQHIGATLRAGVIATNDLLVAQRAAGTNMSVDVAAGQASIPGNDTALQGTYLADSTTVVNVPITAAPGVGTTRIDVIYMRVRDAQVIGGALNDGLISVVNGTASASPTVPALPASSIALADVTVASGTAAITNAMVVDRRQNGVPRTITARSSIGYLLTTASYATWGAEVRIRDVGHPVNVSAYLTAQAEAGAGTTNYIAYTKIDISLSDGFGYTAGQELTHLAGNEYAPSNIANSAWLTGTPVGAIKVRAQAKRGGVNGDVRYGNMVVTVTPA
jgi:hypothetical protein